MPRTRFTHPLSVDIWDACFRWRRGNDLRERTIDETWSRVAGFAAEHEGANRGDWKRRYCAAFRQWQWLPDERLLAGAGTATALRLDEPAAVVNASAFVLDPATDRACFDHEAFAAGAAAAVRFLDGALLAMPSENGKPPDLRVGMLGVADALSRLGIPYDSAGALREAATMASALARGSLQASVALASERGPHPDVQPPQLAPLWRARRMPSALIDDALRHGVRHRQLTAIGSHPLLARLANDASDALYSREPARFAAGSWQGPPAPIRSPETLQPLLAMQRAVQPWIDVPIDAYDEPARHSRASNG